MDKKKTGLKNNIVLGICGSSASIGILYYLMRLKDGFGSYPEIMMSHSATKFVQPAGLEIYTKKRVWLSDTPDPERAWVPHMKLAKDADAILILPATAHCLGAVAAGLVDTLIHSTILATKAPVLFAPAMNADMWDSRVVQRNCQTIRDLGHTIIEPGFGKNIHEGVVEKGALPAFEVIEKHLMHALEACSWKKPSTIQAV